MSSTSYASRINQLDAAQLDTDIYIVFRDQARRITKRLPPGKGDKWQPEIDVLIKFVIWYYSLRTGNSTFGQRLLNLKYANFNQKKAVLYFLLTVIPKYLEERLADTQFSITKNNQIKYYIECAANFIKLLNFLNLLVFLVQGKQPLIVEKILRISSQSASSNKPRNIGYSFMARELLWDGLLELLTIGLPMINFHYLKQMWNRIWFKRKDKICKNVWPLMDDSTTCAYCGERPILPRHAGCEHLFCYYCMKGHFTTMDVFQCPQCGTDLHAANMKIYKPIEFKSPQK